MKFLKNFYFIVFLLFSGVIHSQQVYQVGIAQSAIDPEKDRVSLALGGYAAPWEGRFTLHWNNKGTIPPVTAITGLSDKFYLVSNNNLFEIKANPTWNNPDWETFGKANEMIYLAGSNYNLYALNRKGELQVKPLEKKRKKWKTIYKINDAVSAMAAIDDDIYIALRDGSVRKADISRSKINWLEIQSLKLKNIVSLAANGSKIFALTKEGIIYHCDLKKDKNTWTKSAYKNNITINEDIRLIAFASDVIFGINKENNLFEGEHRSKNDLSVRTMAVKDDKNTVLIISLDLVGINDKFSGIIKEEICKSTGIPPSAVFINTSHTHFAPVTQAWPTWQEFNQIPDSSYLHSIKIKIMDTVMEAVNSMQPANLYFGRGKTDIGFNRSLKDHPELYDNDVDVIKIEYLNNKSANLLFMAACHPVHSTSGKNNYTISANYPGVARKIVENATKTKNSLFLQGAAGDINPVDNDEYLTGKKLANEVLAVINRSMDKLSGSISFFLDTIHVPITVQTKEEIIEFQKQVLNKPGDMIAERDLKWCDIMLKLYEENRMPDSLPVYIHTVNIGKWKLLGYSREPTSEYSIGVKNMWPEKLVSVAGFTNDVSSYLPTKKHIEMKNYEGYESFFWYGMPGTFIPNVHESIMSFIKEKKR